MLKTVRKQTLQNISRKRNNKNCST